MTKLTILTLLLAVPVNAELSKDGIGRMFYTPFGSCQVVPPEVTIPRGHVICTTPYPDVTGDGQAEQLTVITEMDMRGRLRCGSYTLTDLTCPSDLTCHRTLEQNRECFE